MAGVFKDRLLLLLTLALNWVIGPFLMYFLSVAFFRRSYPRFMSGLSLVSSSCQLTDLGVWNLRTPLGQLSTSMSPCTHHRCHRQCEVILFTCLV